MDTIEVQRQGGIVRIRLNRPDRRNAQIPAMWHELRVTGQALIADPEVRCVVISGNGPAFSAGLDTKAYAAGEITGAEVGQRPVESGGRAIGDIDLQVAQAAFRWPTEAPFVTIAAVHGYALGAGCELALACDLRILTEDAYLGLPEASLGMMPDMGGCERLAQLVGYAKAVELALTCRQVDATAARSIGLANSVVPAADLAAAVTELAELVASRPAPAVSYVKRAVAAGAAGDRELSFTLAREGALALGAWHRATQQSAEMA